METPPRFQQAEPEIDVYAFRSALSLRDAARFAERNLRSPAAARYHFAPTVGFLEWAAARGYTWRQDAVMGEHYFDAPSYPLTEGSFWLSQGRTYRATGGDVDYGTFEEWWELGIKDELDAMLVRRIAGDREKVQAAMRERDLGEIDSATCWYCQSLTTRFRLWDGDTPLPAYVSVCFTNDDETPDMAIGRLALPLGDEVLASLTLAPSMADARLALLDTDPPKPAGRAPHRVTLPDAAATDAFVERFLEEHRNDVAFPKEVDSP